MELRCVWCGKHFEAKRRSAKYCSALCKSAMHRYNPKQRAQEHFDAISSHITQLTRLGMMDSDVNQFVYERLIDVSVMAKDYGFSVSKYLKSGKPFLRGTKHLYKSQLI